jgi:hypothetical protein
MKVGGYTLDVYCDGERWQGDSGWKHANDYMPQQFVGRTLASCIRQAKSAGWSCTGKRDICPQCNPRRAAKGEEAVDAPSLGTQLQP